MTKYVPKKLTQLSANESAAIDTINANLDSIKEHIDDSISRSAKTPSQMQADLDMNGQKIINLGAPTADTDLVRKCDVVSEVEEIKQTADAIQAVGKAALDAVDTVALNAQSAANSAISASDSAIKSQKWAEGSDADVSALGGTHSAKGWANQEANNYSVTSTGSTTARVLKDRFADIINVKDYGAKGDGTTDDSSAFSSAVTAAQGKILYIPDGNYKLLSNTFLNGIKDCIDYGNYPSLKPFYQNKKSIELKDSTIELVYEKNYQAIRQDETTGRDEWFANQNICYVPTIDKILVFYVNEDNTKQFIEVLNSSTYALESTIDHTDLGHCNGVAYCSAYDKIYVLTSKSNGDGDKEIAILSRDGTTLIEKKYVSSFDCNTLGWDSEHELFVSITNSNDKLIYLDKDLQKVVEYTDNTHPSIAVNCGNVINGNFWVSSLDRKIHILDPFCHLLETIVLSDEDIEPESMFLKGNDLYMSINDWHYKTRSGIYIFHLKDNNISGNVLNLYKPESYVRRITFKKDLVAPFAKVRMQSFNQPADYQGFYLETFDRTGETYGARLLLRDPESVNDAGTFTLESIINNTQYTLTGYENTLSWNGKRMSLGDSDECIQYTRGNDRRFVLHGGTNNYNSGGSLYLFGATYSSDSGAFRLVAHDGTNSCHLTGNPNGNFDFSGNSAAVRPATTGVKNLGDASHLWKEVFSSTGTINTSDERQKQDIKNIDENVFAAWSKVNFVQFLFKDAVKNKGEKNARVHFGAIAQQIKEAFESEGLDPFKYGLLCYDEWEDEYKDVEIIDKEGEYNENGEEISAPVTHIEKVQVQKAGNSYGIRYSEALALECAYQRWITNKLENRIKALEDK